MFHYNLLIFVYLLSGDYNFTAFNNEYNAKGVIIIIQIQAEKNLEGLEFDPGATHNLGKTTGIPGHTSSGDFL